MGTSKFQQHIPSLHNGISRQAPSVRFANQVADAKNVMFSITDGAVKRPGTRYHSSNQATGTLTNSNRIHKIERDDNEQYLVVYGRGTNDMLISVAQVNNPRNRRQWLTITGAPTSFKLTFDAVLSGVITYSATPATMASNLQTAITALAEVGAGKATVTNVATNVYAVDFDDNLESKKLLVPSDFVGGTSPAISVIGSNANIIFGANTQDYLNSGNSTAESLRFLTITDTTIIANKNVAVATTATVNSTANTGLSAASMPIKMVRTSLFPPTFTLSQITWNSALDSSRDQKITYSGGAAFTLTFGGQTTTSIVTNPNGNVIRDALAALTTVGIGKVDVIKIDYTYNIFFKSTTTGTGLITSSTPAAVISTLVNDQSTAPTPFKLGYAISDLVYHRGRLGFAMEEWTVFSQPDDLYNFFPERNDQVDESDPIALQIGADTVSKISYLVPFRKGILIMTQGGRQFDLGSGDTFTAASATFTPSTRYSNQFVRPSTVGSTIYFAGTRENCTPIWEYIYDEFALTNKATDITTHVSDLIPSSVRSICSSDNNNTIIVVPTNTANLQNGITAYSNMVTGNWSNAASWIGGLVPIASTNVEIAPGAVITFDKYTPLTPLYVYKKYEAGGELLQSAWGIYDFRSDCIEDVVIINDTAYILEWVDPSISESFTSSQWMVLHSLPLTQSPTPPTTFVHQPRLDKRTVITKTGNQPVGYTSFVMPLTADTIDTAIVMEDGIWTEYDALQTSPGSNTVTVQAELNDLQVVLGRKINMSIELSQVYARDQQGNSILDNEIEIAKTIVDHRNAGEYSITTQAEDRNDRVVNFVPTTTIEKVGKTTAWTTGRAANMKIIIESDTPKPLSIISVEYIGRKTTTGIEESQ